jgi:hypothetical protein
MENALEIGIIVEISTAITRHLIWQFEARCKLLTLKNVDDVTDGSDRREDRNINNNCETDIKGRSKFAPVLA